MFGKKTKEPINLFDIFKLKQLPNIHPTKSAIVYTKSYVTDKETINAMENGFVSTLTKPLCVVSSGDNSFNLHHREYKEGSFVIRYDNKMYIIGEFKPAKPSDDYPYFVEMSYATSKPLLNIFQVARSHRGVPFFVGQTNSRRGRVYTHRNLKNSFVNMGKNS